MQRAIRLLFEGCDLLVRVRLAQPPVVTDLIEQHRAAVEAFLEQTVNDARIIALARKTKPPS